MATGDESPMTPDSPPVSGVTGNAGVMDKEELEATLDKAELKKGKKDKNKVNPDTRSIPMATSKDSGFENISPKEKKVSLGQYTDLPLNV